MRERGDEVIDIGSDDRLFDTLFGNALLAVEDVVAQAAAEHPCILQHHGEEIAHVGAGERFDGDAVDEDIPFAFVKAHQKIDKRRLTCARGADDGDLLPRFDRRGEIAEDGVGSIIPEGDVAEFDGAFHLFGRNVRGGRFLRFFLLFEEFKDAACGGRGGLEQVRRLPELRQGRLEEVDVEKKGGKIAERCPAARHQDAPYHADGDIAELGDEGRQGMGDRRDDIGAVHGSAEAFVALFEALKGALLCTVSADEFERGVVLLRTAVERSEPLLLGAEVLLRTAHDEGDDKEREGNGRKGGERHPRVGEEHHDDDDDELHRRRERRAQRACHGLGDGIDVVGDAGERIAQGVAVEIAHGKPAELGGDIRAQTARDALIDARHEIGLQIRAERGA